MLGPWALPWAVLLLRMTQKWIQAACWREPVGLLDKFLHSWNGLCWSGPFSSHTISLKWGVSAKREVRTLEDLEGKDSFLGVR